MNPPTVLLSVNTAWNAWNFRAGLIQAIRNQGYRVVVAAPTDSYAERLVQAGCDFIDLPMDSNGMHPGRDLRLLMRYVLLLRAQSPVVYLGYTIKPNVYGSIAAHMLGIPVINNIAGLGAAFIGNSVVRQIACMLYRTALRKSARVFFQNADDRQLFTGAGLVRSEMTGLLPGSGIALSRYQPSAEEEPAHGVRFLLVGRMLINKGVLEFAEAARIVRRSMPTARFQLLGPVHETNPNLVPMETLRAWQAEGLVEYLGPTEDVRPYIAAADCVVLPSYREGVPRTLLEAAAMARPIIATDVPGCRDVVDDQVNGLLCRVRDPHDLAARMLAVAAMPVDARRRMGAAGRRKVEREFDEALVIGKYLDAIAGVGIRRPRAGAPAPGPASPADDENMEIKRGERYEY